MTDDAVLSTVLIKYDKPNTTLFIHGDGAVTLQTKVVGEGNRQLMSPRGAVFPTCRWHVAPVRIRELVQHFTDNKFTLLPNWSPTLYVNAGPEDLPDSHTISITVGGAAFSSTYEYGPKASEGSRAPATYLQLEAEIERLKAGATGSGPCSFAPALNR